MLRTEWEREGGAKEWCDVSCRRLNHCSFIAPMAGQGRRGAGEEDMVNENRVEILAQVQYFSSAAALSAIVAAGVGFANLQRRGFSDSPPPSPSSILTPVSARLPAPSRRHRPTEAVVDGEWAPSHQPPPSLNNPQFALACPHEVTGVQVFPLSIPTPLALLLSRLPSCLGPGVAGRRNSQW